jgi:uncharacterized protein involved in type VI secretion and phage assembly
VFSTTDEPGDRGRWYGKYRAFVRDASDPARLGRLRLEIPAVLGTGPANWSAWAAPCFPYGGNPDCGLYLLPEVGASVWAEFEMGDAQCPIWSGVWLAGPGPGEMPAEAAASPVTAKVLKTAGGHVLLFEDAPGGLRVTLVSAGDLLLADGAGSEVRLAGGAIIIRATGQVQIN